jgi:DNA processing protein
MTEYGQEVTAKLTRELSLEGFTIVSGMALGVDGVAHQTSIDAGGKTIAVLGAGVEVIYPREHTQLYQSIFYHDGAILSEVAPEKIVGRGMFPARNRIVSGLAEAVLVTEGAIDSGSLITARMALEQGREVFAVPGPINSALAEGTNYLLKQGARLVTSAQDILESLGCG